MNLPSFLDEQGVNYRLSHHADTYTSQDLAQTEHIPGLAVVKPVLVKADGQFYLCALPATHKIDLGELRRQLNAHDVHLADEAQMMECFPDCELGAEPPIGRFWGLTTLMDESLTADNRVTFQAGSHALAVTMTLAEYRRIARPEMAHFARPI